MLFSAGEETEQQLPRNIKDILEKLLLWRDYYIHIQIVYYSQ